MSKQRITVTVDEDVAAAARRAVEYGEYENLSVLVTKALKRELKHFERLKAMGEAIAAYEAEFGEITEQDMDEAERWFEENTIWPNRDKKRNESVSKAA